MVDPRKFKCVDCEVDVASYAPPPPGEPNLCSVCYFLRTVPNVEKREELRRYLQGDKDAKG